MKNKKSKLFDVNRHGTLGIRLNAEHQSSLEHFCDKA